MDLGDFHSWIVPACIFVAFGRLQYVEGRAKMAIAEAEDLRSQLKSLREMLSNYYQLERSVADLQRAQFERNFPPSRDGGRDPLMELAELLTSGHPPKRGMAETSRPLAP
jgi:hypothetical protein